MDIFCHDLSFEVNRCLVSDGAMEPAPVVEGFDVVEDGQAGLLFCFVGFGDTQFCLQGGPEGFHGGVVVAIAGASHAGQSPVHLQLAAKRFAGVLAAAVGVDNESSSGLMTKSIAGTKRSRTPFCRWWRTANSN